MKRAAPLQRGRVAQRLPKVELVIVCEGKVTEPRYFKDLQTHSRNSLVGIRTVPACGVPISVVERAVQEKQLLEAKAKKTRDSFDTNFEVWAVFDRDAHPNPQVPAAFNLAHAHDVKIAFSNPCFEVWGLMHFDCWGRPGHHHETQRDLKKHLAGYCHNSNPIFDLSKLMRLYDSAVLNAKRAAELRKKEGGTEYSDPSTSVYELTERIRQNGHG